MANGRNAADGWLGVHPDSLRFLFGVPIPRRGSYLRQLRYNLRCFLPWAMLIPGAATLVVGVWQGWWHLAVPGAGVVAGYFLLSWNAAAALREGRLVIGAVQAQVLTLAEAGGVAEADAVLPDGEAVRLYVPAAPTASLFERYGRAEVLLLCLPDRTAWQVLGVRAPADRAGEAAAAGPAPDPGPAATPGHRWFQRREGGEPVGRYSWWSFAAVALHAPWVAVFVWILRVEARAHRTPPVDLSSLPALAYGLFGGAAYACGVVAWGFDGRQGQRPRGRWLVWVGIGLAALFPLGWVFWADLVRLVRRM